MARTQPAPPFSPSPAVAYDPYLDLGRLLNRLEQNILRADGDKWRRLVTDEFQRMQARFDVAAARNLLARIEQDTSSPVKNHHGKRQEVQAELNRRRALVEHLQERLDDLDEEARTAAVMRGDDDESEDEEETSDALLAQVLRPPKEGTQVKTANVTENGAAPETTKTPTPTPASILRTDSDMSSSTSTTTKPKRKRRVRIAATATTIPAAAAPTPTTTMRLRSSARKEKEEKEAATSSALEEPPTQEESLTTMRNSLLSTSSGPAGESTAGVATEEAVLDLHRREQEEISEDILRLATALKERSMTTAQMLEDDKDVVSRVGEGLHTTNENLSAASRSMAVLTRMTEGKGWWGRMVLFAMVYGLMLVLLLLFLFLPKLRL